MTLLNRKCDYALLLLCYLHRKTLGASAREIADHFRISRSFVANILKDLCQKGFVASQRGVRGGYTLLPATANATLADLLDVLEEEKLCLAECNQPQPESCCALLESCPIRAPIAEVHWRLRAVLEQVKLGDLFQNRETLTIGVERCHVVNQSGGVPVN